MSRSIDDAHHSDLYKRYRRATPDFIIQKIINWMHQPEFDQQKQPKVSLNRKFDTVVDVGCGSGQHTVSLAPYFRSVRAFDLGEAQITQARLNPVCGDHVTYAVAPAEQLPLQDGSAQLITGNLSFHWFDLVRFYREVDRVLVPGGVVAAVGYMAMPKVLHDVKGQELELLLENFEKRYIGRGSSLRSLYYYSGYRTMPLPYEEVYHENNLPFVVQGTLADLIGVLSARGTFQREYRKDAEKLMLALETFQNDFLDVLCLDANTKLEDVPLVLRYDYYLAMCRKPGTLLHLNDCLLTNSG